MIAAINGQHAYVEIVQNNLQPQIFKADALDQVPEG